MFEKTQVGEVAVVKPKENLEASNSSAVKKFLIDSIEGESNRMVVDLTELRFVDSSGLGALIAALKTAQAKGGDVRLCGLSSSVQTIFELTRLNRVFKMFGSVDEAVASFT
jgi:anti-sigma B factor antagonist